MDYEKKYNEALERARNLMEQVRNNELLGFPDQFTEIFPEPRESEDERIRTFLLDYAIEMIAGLESDISLSTYDGIKGHDPDAEAELTQWQKARAYLEKQKDASKAIEAVDRIDKYIDEHLANAHDMKDSNPDKKYYRGWDDALGKMSGILQDVYSGEKQKERPISVEEVLARAGLKPYKDGNQWCILVGDNIQEGICGFGDTIEDALYEFLEEVLDLQKKQEPVHTAKEMWEEMRLELYAQASGNRHEPNYSDDSTKMFSLCDIDEIFEKIGSSTVGSQPAEWSEEDERKIVELKTFLAKCKGFNRSNRQKAFEMIDSLRPSWRPSEQEKGALRTAIRVLTEERNFPKAASHLQAILDAFDGKESRKDWKPSEEHLSALLAIFNDPNNIGSQTCQLALSDLYEQLKKLT